MNNFVCFITLLLWHSQCTCHGSDFRSFILMSGCWLKYVIILRKSFNLYCPMKKTFTVMNGLRIRTQPKHRLINKVNAKSLSYFYIPFPLLRQIIPTRGKHWTVMYCCITLGIFPIYFAALILLMMSIYYNKYIINK